MDKFTAVDKASAYIEANGFKCTARSNLSEATYFCRAGRSQTLRVAAHACRHPFNVASQLTIEYREAWERDENRVAWIGSETDLFDACEAAIAEYDASEEDEDDE